MTSTPSFDPERTADLGPNPGNAPSSDQAPGDAERHHAAIAERPGASLGPYKLLQQIGEGGFGVVFMAEQTEPVRRQVALKIIKLGMDTREVIARFEAERQALAMMDHPNIARVLDAGATETGRPFFVMELVRGIPITKYCDEQHLTVRQRLELFIDVCSAVQHAHQKGVIHRDLKPSNVMVTLHGTTAVPKVIDFGVSKATHQRLTDKTLFTQYGAFVGTPQYMAPEQAEMSGLDVDTRADIYSLGVMLYELLTGSTPIDPEKLKAAGPGQLHEIIQHTQIQRPSTHISTNSTPSDLATNRGVDIHRLGTLLKGDLDWIVLKAAAKERARRYDSASALADDILRYLGDEQVLATPPSLAYKASKFIKRNRIAVTAGAALTVALLAGIAATSTASIWALRQRELAREAEQRALDEAERSIAIANFTTTLLTGIDPNATDPDLADQSDLSTDDVIARAGELFGEDSSAIAELLFSWGTVLVRLGDTDRAETALREADTRQAAALGADHPNRAATLLVLAETLASQNKHTEASELDAEAVRIREVAFGPDHALVADALLQHVDHLAASNLNLSELQPIARRAATIRIESLGPEHPRTIDTFFTVGALLFIQGDSEGATEFLTKGLNGARAIGRIDERYIQSLNSLVLSLISSNRDDEAVDYFAELIDLVIERNFGGSQAVMLAMTNHAAWLEGRGDDEAAKGRFLAIAERARSTEPQTTQVLVYLHRTARSLSGYGEADAAQDVYEIMVRVADATDGASSRSALKTRLDLAEFLLDQGEPTRARPVVNEAVEIASLFPTDDDEALRAQELSGRVSTTAPEPTP
ncbi:MAG: serine/threonine-protein kinase [Planctomycetota bacterium]